MNTSSTKPSRRRWFARVRLGVLLVLVAGAATLLHWSRNHDPRFYWFVQTAPGRGLARMLDWNTGVRPLPPDEHAEAWTEEERTALAELRARMTAIRPETRLTLADGRVLEGKVVEHNGERLMLEVKYDVDLGVRMSIDPGQVVQRERLDAPFPPISRRDVQFHLDFPEYGFFRRPPFTIITDRSAFEAEDAVAMLQRLHTTLTDELEPLVRSNGSPDGIQLLFFSNEAAYQEYVDRLAPHLEFSSGFYSPSQDRLVWFDQAGSFESKALRNHIAEEEAHYRQRARHPEQQRRVEMAAKRARRHLDHVADAESRRVLRHEGAHQLFFTLGIHSEHYAENPWLLEGLAQYYEETTSGRIPGGQEGYLRGPLAADDPLPVERLMNLRSYRGLHELEDPEMITLGYIRSAALVRWLMHPAQRRGFIAWLKEIRAPAQVWRAATDDHIAWLAEHLGMDRDEMLERMRVEAFEGE